MEYMKYALELAKKGQGYVSPNPMVGAVIVKEDQIIGTGYHEYYGGPHAEVNAFASATQDPKGATLYVTLEPCAHYGKTPPCVDLVIEKGIKKVVIGMKDPNPLVAGKSIEKLKAHQIEVIIDVLKDECEKLNQAFIKYITTQRPFVLMKVGMSLDGKIATTTGDSQWITNETSRQQVHELRHAFDAIFVGAETVLKDNPRLTCRLPHGKNPVRVVVDSQLRIPSSVQVYENLDLAPTIVATTYEAPIEKVKELTEKGVSVLRLPTDENGQVDLKALMVELGKRRIASILLEGGATLNFSALKAQVVDCIRFYIAPKLIGGRAAKSAIGGEGVLNLKDAFSLENLEVSYLGEDLVVEAQVKKGGYLCSQEL